MPPFDSILGWGGSPTDSERTLSKSEESMKSLATDPGEPDEDQDPHSTDECYRQHDRSHAAQQARDNSDSTTASDQPHTPQPPDAAQSLQAPRNHQAAGGHEVASTSPTTQPPNRPRGPKPPKTVQNKPFSTQKPTSEVSQDVGLSVECLVGLAGFEPTTP